MDTLPDRVYSFLDRYKQLKQTEAVKRRSSVLDLFGRHKALKARLLRSIKLKRNSSTSSIS